MRFNIIICGTISLDATLKIIEYLLKIFKFQNKLELFEIDEVVSYFQPKILSISARVN